MVIIWPYSTIISSGELDIE